MQTWNGARWSAAVRLAEFTQDLSCVTPTFCMAVAGDVTYRYDGTGWQPEDVPEGLGLGRISCTSATLCLMSAATDDGRPAAFVWDGTTWGQTPAVGLPETSIAVTDVSCSSTTFCVLVSYDGTAARWDGTAWHRLPDLAGHTIAVSCSGPRFCLAGDYDDNRVQTFDGTSWSTPTTVGADGDYLQAVDCPSAGRCVAVVAVRLTPRDAIEGLTEFTGAVAVYDGSTWSQPTSVDPVGKITDVSCADAGYCLAVDSTGSLVGRAA